MKFKVESIDNLSDSKEVMDLKPRMFITMYIYILIVIIVTFLAWAWFSEKEIVVKASGIVKPSSNTYYVSNMSMGEVEKINIKDGQDIAKGDLMIKLDSSELEKQKKILSEQISNLEKDNKNLNKLVKSINDKTNYFEESSEEKEYYYKYEMYKLANKSPKEEKENLNELKNDLLNKKNYLELLKKSINEGNNLISDESIYNEQFNSYKSSKESIENKISNLEKSRNIIKNNEQLDKNQLSEVESEVENNKNQLSKLKIDTDIQVQSSIDEINNQIKNIDSDIEKLDETSSLNKEKNNIATLAQIEESINSNRDKIEEFKDNIIQVEENINRFNIRAAIDGQIDMKQDIEPGIVLQAGTVIANIIPKDSSYKVELVIQNKDIANLQEGQNIKYSFESLPYKKYGFFNGKLESIGVDSRVDSETKVSFFTGQGTLDKNILFNHKKEKINIKSGMTCTARIVTRKEKMINYLLEKIDLGKN